MLTPINNFVLIEPAKHESFVVQERETYQEIGKVVALSKGVSDLSLQVGDTVFFDSWMVSKYPKNDNENYWLINYSDIRAYERE